jgi:hypothetical protein
LLHPVFVIDIPTNYSTVNFTLPVEICVANSHSVDNLHVFYSTGYGWKQDRSATNSLVRKGDYVCFKVTHFTKFAV